jgi:hypothetical protein
VARPVHSARTVLDPNLDRTAIVTTLRALLRRYRDELVRVDRELVPKIRELADQLRRVEAAHQPADN